MVPDHNDFNRFTFSSNTYKFAKSFFKLFNSKCYVKVTWLFERVYSSGASINCYGVVGELNSLQGFLENMLNTNSIREKGRDLTQSYDKAPTPTEKSKKQRDNI